MKFNSNKTFSTFIFLAVIISISWGSWGHKHISHAAVFALPDEMKSFYYNHIDFITEESVVPDVRKATMSDKTEGHKHYIDIEGFNNTQIDSFPKTYADAKNKFTEKVLDEQGVLPWHINEMMEKLTKAFQNKDKSQILFLSGDLAHYIADANMPLHTSSNHDGQLTDQKGIHSFWESRIPELFGENYNFKVEKAVYLKDVSAETWAIIKNSHELVDQLLLVDKNTKANFDKDKLYKKDEKGELILNKYKQKIQSNEYAEAFHKALNGMVESQMRHSIKDVSNFWYTAWVNGGKPNLDDLDAKVLTKSNSNRLRKENKLLNKKGKLFGLESVKEND
ncbi:MAG: zinc dependent phospholipase C family protein [Flavobacterium sp.]|uniref:zinc dependent phospholipase C family protein n=1 Tax=Flavobacterium sp. TaxID=239 RepID=UPI003267F58B